MTAPVQPLDARRTGVPAATFASSDVALVLLIGVVLLRISEIGARDHGLPTFTLPASVGIVLLVFALRRETEQASRQLVALGAVVVAYLASMLASTLVAGDAARSMRVVATTLRDLAAAAAVVALVTTVRRLHVAVWTFISAGGLLGLLGVLQHVSGTLSDSFGGLMGAPQPAVIGGADRLELAGPENSPNFLAKVLMVVALLACERALNARHWSQRLFATAVVGVTVASIVFTYSRGALIALVVGAVVIVFGVARRQRRVILGALAIAAVVFALTQSAFITHLADATPGASTTSSAAMSDTSINGRTSEYRVAIDMFLDHPVLGVGRKNYDRLYQSYAVRYGLDDRAGERGVPNVWLEALAELGMVGLVAFAAIPIVMILLLWRARRRFTDAGDLGTAGLCWGVIAAVAGFLANSMFEGGRSIYVLWLLCALAVSADGISVAGVRPRNSAAASTTVERSKIATGTA